MVGEGTTAIFVTFLLAILGYVGLTTVVVVTVRGRWPLALWRGVAAVILVHVVMVWTFRYGGRFDLAVRNGYTGFLLFHGALTLILLSAVLPERVARLLIHLSFLIVTAGALGASFLYDVVAAYRLPVIVCSLTGGVSLVSHYLVSRHRPGGGTAGP